MNVNTLMGIIENTIELTDSEYDELKEKISIKLTYEDSSWSQEDAQRDGGGFTDAEILESERNNW